MEIRSTITLPPLLQRERWEVFPKNRETRIWRGDTKLLYEGVLQFVEFLNSKENKQSRKKSIERVLDTNKLYRIETC